MIDLGYGHRFEKFDQLLQAFLHGIDFAGVGQVHRAQHIVGDFKAFSQGFYRVFANACIGAWYITDLGWIIDTAEVRMDPRRAPGKQRAGRRFLVLFYAVYRTCCPCPEGYRYVMTELQKEHHLPVQPR